jgi:exonuclease V gamma subunit
MSTMHNMVMIDQRHCHVVRQGYSTRLRFLAESHLFAQRPKDGIEVIPMLCRIRGPIPVLRLAPMKKDPYRLVIKEGTNHGAFPPV